MKRIAILGSALAHILMTAVADEAGSPAGAGAAAAAAAPAADGTKIRPNMENYQTAKSAGGSSTKICGDAVSLALLGANLDEAYGFVADVTSTAEAVLREKYGDKNPGQQRMFLGNLIRGASQSKDAEKKARVEAAFAQHLPAFREKIDARLAVATKAAEETKLAKAKEKEEAKAKIAADKKAEADKKAKEKADKKLADETAAKLKAAAQAASTPAKPAGAAPQAKGPGTPQQPK